MAAFEAGLSPEIVHVEPGIMVLRFIEGRTFGEADMRANIARLVPLLKDCHTKVGRHVRGSANAFWVFQVIRDYVTLLDADRRYLDVAERLEQAQVPLPIVFGHHDLLPGNFMDDGKQALADRLGVWRLRHGDVRSRQPVVQRRVRRGPRTRPCSMPISEARSLTTCAAPLPP